MSTDLVKAQLNIGTVSFKISLLPPGHIFVPAAYNQIFKAVHIICGRKIIIGHHSCALYLQHPHAVHIRKKAYIWHSGEPKPFKLGKLCKPVRILIISCTEVKLFQSRKQLYS